MRLVDFIEVSSADIVGAAVTYARTLPPLAHESDEALRDHIPKILEAVVDDLRQYQSTEASQAKALGEAPVQHSAFESAAQTHGRMRARSGLHVSQLVAEYRALRAGVLQLWAATDPGGASVKEVTRFNEAIDQAIAESIEFFADEMDQVRNLFLGVLSHDLRGPLNAILLSSELISKRTEGLPEVSHTLGVLIRSGRRMGKLLDSLLEFNKSSLGIGLRVHRTEVDLAEECHEEMEILSAALPRAQLDFVSAGETSGEFDGSAVREAVANLVYNAAAYGDDAPIRIELQGSPAEVVVSVSNAGVQIPAEQIARIFQPLKRGVLQLESSRTNLGLGLFVVDQIARAHEGEASCTSTPHRTVFTLRLPRWTKA